MYGVIKYNVQEHLSVFLEKMVLYFFNVLTTFTLHFSQLADTYFQSNLQEQLVRKDSNQGPMSYWLNTLNH